MKHALTLKQIKRAEKKIGVKAAALIRKSLLQSIERYNLNTDNTSEESLKNSLIVKEKMGSVRLFRIHITMADHGFVLQHGATKRSGHIRKKGKWKNENEAGSKNKKPFYSVKEHGFMLTKRPFIEAGIQNSGAFEILLKEIGELRMKEVAVVFNRLDIKIS